MKYVITPVDKANTNIDDICKRFLTLRLRNLEQLQTKGTLKLFILKVKRTGLLIFLQILKIVLTSLKRETTNM